MANHGGVLLNYVRVIALTKRANRVSGVRALDVETGAEFEIEAKVVINATGVFADEVRRLDNAEVAPTLAPSQGTHLVLDASFLPGEVALMVPRTDDGRVLFAIPWLGRVLVGTTDTGVSTVAAEPRPLAVEIDFLLEHAARYLAKTPTRGNVLSAFAGLRPLVKSTPIKAASRLARDHMIGVSDSGLVTIIGGKWTTFRRMAEDVIDAAVQSGGLEQRACVTENLRIPASPPHTEISVGEADVLGAVRKEMARTVEDVLARRTRTLFLDARASLEAAPQVATIMAGELGRDEQWEADQVRRFRELASGYLV
jgi:glycerol-3-phosphate dehydrogenase